MKGEERPNSVVVYASHPMPRTIPRFMAVRYTGT